MKKIKAFVAIAGLFAFTSCSITYPYTATNNPIGDKVGRSKTTIIFGGAGGAGGGNIQNGVFSTNKNFGVIEAARKGDIDKVATVDIKATNFVFFQKVEVIVTGE